MVETIIIIIFPPSLTQMARVYIWFISLRICLRVHILPWIYWWDWIIKNKTRTERRLVLTFDILIEKENEQFLTYKKFLFFRPKLASLIKRFFFVLYLLFTGKNKWLQNILQDFLLTTIRLFFICLSLPYLNKCLLKRRSNTGFSFSQGKRT